MIGAEIEEEEEEEEGFGYGYGFIVHLCCREMVWYGLRMEELG